MKRKSFCSIILFLLIASGFTGLQAQNSDENLYEQLRQDLKKEYLSVGAFVQFRGTAAFGEPRANAETGFTVPHARLKFSGKLNGGFSYNLHFDIADSPIILDAQAGYSYNEALNITAGAQKPGISAEFLQSPGALDLATRSQVVSALVQNRDIGVRVHGKMNEEMNYSFAIFNGNGIAPNDNNQFYYAGRLAYSPDLSDEARLNLGINASFGEQNNTRIGNGSLFRIDGKRVIYGADIRYETQKFLLSSELLAASLEYEGFPDDDNDTIVGYHVTGGYKFTPQTHGLIRWDSIDSDRLAYVDNNLLILGLNTYPSGQTKFQINYRIPTDDSEFENHGIVANFNIGF